MLTPWSHFCGTPYGDGFISGELRVRFGFEAWGKDLPTCNGFSFIAFFVGTQCLYSYEMHWSEQDSICYYRQVFHMLGVPQGNGKASFPSHETGAPFR